MNDTAVRKTILTAISFAALVMFVIPAHAQRPDTRAYSCSQVVGTIKQYGSLVWTTGQHTYARIVSNRGYCKHGQVPEQKYAPTLDNPRCRVGFTCRERLFQK